MLTIGLTGAIATGKSEVASILKALGASVIDADQLGHLAYRSGTPGWQQVVDTFGREIVGPDGEVDRRKLGAAVFGDPAALQRLNQIVHPIVRTLLEQQLISWRKEGVKVAVVEVVLLFQAGWDTLFDEIWIVTAPPDQMTERLQRTRGLSVDDANKRIVSQSHARDSGIVIDNSGSKEQLATRVRQLWESRILARGIGHD